MANWRLDPSWSLFLMAVVVGLSMGSATNAQTVGKDTTTASISGVVVDNVTNKAVRGARVTMLGGEPRGVFSVLTDGGGGFVFDKLAPGRYTLSATKFSFVETYYANSARAALAGGTPLIVSGGDSTKVTVRLLKGGVVTGRIVDEQGDPAPRVSVRVIGYGTRDGRPVVLTGGATGAGMTDDRGVYRLYGLVPGAYLIEAEPNRLDEAGMLQARAARVAADRDPGSVTSTKRPVTGYAPVFFPGTTSPTSAKLVSVQAGEERADIDFQLERVPLVTVTGVVVSSTAISGSQVSLVATTPVPGVVTPLVTQADPDGRFTIAGVAPGRYSLIARAVELSVPSAPVSTDPVDHAGSVGDSVRLWGRQEITVEGEDVDGVALSLQRGSTISGHLAFHGTRRPIPADLRMFRINLVPVEVPGVNNAVAVQSSAVVDPAGEFRVTNVTPGAYRLISVATAGWQIESATVGGQETLDFPVEVKAGQDCGGAVVTFSDSSTRLSGVVAQAASQLNKSGYLVVFPTDSTYWTPWSRRVSVSRTAADGSFVVTGLPPGEYNVGYVADDKPAPRIDAEYLRQVESSTEVTITAGADVKTTVTSHR